jgi:hypothetical protein
MSKYEGHGQTSCEPRCQRKRLEVCERKEFDNFTDNFKGNSGESFDGAIVPVVDGGQGKGELIQWQVWELDSECHQSLAANSMFGRIIPHTVTT